MNQRKKARATRNQLRKARYERGELGKGRSNYGRKEAYLNKHGLWGFEVPEPKPWRKRR
jgi:hypothetical protein